MATALLLKLILAGIGVGTIVRAVHRRISRTPRQRPLDPQLTRGLKIMGVCAALAVVAVILVTLGWLLEGPHWVVTVAAVMICLAAAVWLPLALWIGWRAGGEEFPPGG